MHTTDKNVKSMENKLAGLIGAQEQQQKGKAWFSINVVLPLNILFNLKKYDAGI